MVWCRRLKPAQSRKPVSTASPMAGLDQRRMAAISRPLQATPQRKQPSHAMGWARVSIAHTSQAHCRGFWFPIRLGSRRWHRGRPALANRRMRKTGTRALRFVASAYIPTRSSGGSAGMFQRGSRKQLAGYGSEQHSQTLHRQAKHNSQNPLTIAIRFVCRQPG